MCRNDGPSTREEVEVCRLYYMVKKKTEPRNRWQRLFSGDAISYKIQPTAQISTLLFHEASSFSNSGARYPDVPLEYRVVLQRFDVPSEMGPKSEIFQTRARRE